MISYPIRTVAALPIAIALVLTGHGSATAAPPPNQENLKYADAVKALKDAGYTAVVAAKFGDRTPLSDCRVVHQHLRGEAQSTKKKVNPSTVLLSLTCYAGTASATAPGESAVTPASRARAAAPEKTD